MRIHYFAAARAATGVSEEPASAFDTLGELLGDAAARHTGARTSGLSLADILERCTSRRRPAAERATGLAGAQRVDVLPPFAGARTLFGARFSRARRADKASSVSHQYGVTQVRRRPPRPRHSA